MMAQRNAEGWMGHRARAGVVTAAVAAWRIPS
jgi:hypothetical protein